jgi:hypothetical protein
MLGMISKVWVSLLLLAAFCCPLASCGTTLPMVGGVDGGEHAQLRYDGNSLVAWGKIDLKGFVRFKGATAVYFAGPVSLVGGKVLVTNRDLGYREELRIVDGVLPAFPKFVRDDGLFTDEEIARLKITFAE